MDKKKQKLCMLVALLAVYVVATYYSFEVDNAVLAVALQLLTNIASAGIGALMMFSYIFISKLPH